MATWTAPRNWVAGETVTAALLNSHLRDNLLAIGQAWTSYTPALTASSVNPTLGTGSTASGAYIAAGKLIVVSIQIKFGTSGTAAGTGTYRISLPVAAVTTRPVLAGAAYLFDSSGTAMAAPVPHIQSSTTLDFIYPVAWPSGAFTTVGAALPWAWAASDELNVSVVYQGA